MVSGGVRTDGGPTDLGLLDSTEPSGSPLEAAPEREADGVPTASVASGGVCFPVILVLAIPGGALLDLVALALAAAFLSMPYSAAFLAILERGFEPGRRPGDLLRPCASLASARAL